jgi:glycosyltransferase involved in cell wall biosynthesis
MRTNRMPMVSVILPSFNYAQYLQFAVQGVLSQKYSDLELIIVDDCSGDGSREIAEEWKRLDDRVVTIFHAKNRGLACTRNTGLKASAGKFIALCDSDDIWQPDKLKIQLEHFRDNDQVGIVHSEASIIDGSGALTGQRFSGLFHMENQVTSGNLFSELCRRNFLCVPSVVLRREALEYAGGFDESLRSLEDWVCWTKVSRKYLFKYIEEPLVQYRMHGASLSHNSKGMATNRIKAICVLLEALSDINSRPLATMLYSLGMSYLELGQAREAVPAFAKSLAAHPVQLRAWVRFCQASVFALKT